MQQIVDWLQKLGLGQYAQRFAENDIAFVILPDVSDQDSEKIGVVSLERLLLRAIAELKGPTAAGPRPIDFNERLSVNHHFWCLIKVRKVTSVASENALAC
jgi:hypothetical protein